MKCMPLLLTMLGILHFALFGSGTALRLSVLTRRTASRKTLCVFGATGNAGRQVVKQAAALGYNVRAFVRDPSKLQEVSKYDIIKGDITNASAVINAIEGTDVVISTVGDDRAKNYPIGLMTKFVRDGILEGMRKHRVKRLIYLSGGLVIAPGQMAKSSPMLFALLTQAYGMKHQLDDHQGVMDHLAKHATDLEWTVVRPPAGCPFVNKDEPLTELETITSLQEVPEGGEMNTRDFARWLLEVVEDESTIKKAPFAKYSVPARLQDSTSLM
eukprot:gnl/TRDRNA2_/TRDRNA2_74710_c0_seq1.p1 gnl/TRDRNA2_/TRDRNA2_74710_c0~~gnl/TRDRNA2_/TRDRNA2_74710_c0_seq1.p1  ORF type:complete len:271 (+),score=43.93 gnl/TRDRNA2_/TRDRNA2_74710_c0_seq1:32-844(+)